MIEEFLEDPRIDNIVKRGLIKIKYKLGGYATIYGMNRDLKIYGEINGNGKREKLRSIS